MKLFHQKTSIRIEILAFTEGKDCAGAASFAVEMIRPSGTNGTTSFHSPSKVWFYSEVPNFRAKVRIV